MAPSSYPILSTANAVSPSAPSCRTRCVASRIPELAANLSPPRQNEVEIVELLRDLDALQKQYDEGLHDIHGVRTALSVERKKREVFENTCLDLEREKQRLLKAQLATYERASKQLDYASKYENALQLIKAAQEKSNLNSKEQETMITTLRTHHEAQVGDLYKQIMMLKQELASKEHAVLALEKELADSLTPDALRVKLQETEKRIHDSYQDEIEGLKKTLKAEEIENQNLQSQLQNAHLTLMVSNVNHDDQLRELSANRQADIFKQKVMKLRKDNEVVRQHLRQNLPK